MNAEECAIVQKLVSKLDDSRLFYRALTPCLRDGHARFLVSRLIDCNATAADDLARQILLTGGLSASRGGHALTRIRSCATYWMLIASADRDASCLKRIARHGDRVMRHFQAVMVRVKDLNQGHQRQLLALERAHFRVESLASEIGTWRPMDDVSPMRTIADLLNQQRSRR